MFFNNPRKQFLFLTSGALSNRNRNLTVPGRCPVSHILWQCLFLHWLIKIYLTLWNSNIINDIMRAWHVTGTTIHIHLYTCKLLFVWYHFILFKTSGQTSSSIWWIRTNMIEFETIAAKYYQNVCSSSTFNMHVHVVNSREWSGQSSVIPRVTHSRGISN